MFVMKPSGRIEFFTEGSSPKIEQGDVIISLSKRTKEFNKIQEKLTVQREQENQKSVDS